MTGSGFPEYVTAGFARTPSALTNIRNAPDGKDSNRCNTGVMDGPDPGLPHPFRPDPPTVPRVGASWRTNKLFLGLAFVGLLAYLAPGPPGYVQSLVLPVMIDQAGSNGVKVDEATRRAMNRLGIVYDSRVDLQSTFGRGRALDTRRLLDWARSYPDSSALPLRRFDATFERVISQWDDPGSLGPSSQSAVRGLP